MDGFDACRIFINDVGRILFVSVNNAKLSTNGGNIYRSNLSAIYLKHPNYLVVAVETFVLPLIFGSWRTAVIFSVLNAFMMRVRIRVENDALNGLRST